MLQQESIGEYMADDGGDKRKEAAEPGPSGKKGGGKKKGRNRGTPMPLEFLGFNSTPSNHSSREYPHGFRSRQQWLDQTRPLAHAVRAATDTQDHESPPPVFIAGSAVTGVSFADKPKRPAGTPFGPHSDFDMAVASPELYAAVTTDRSLKSDDGGSVKTRALHAHHLHNAGHRGLADGVGELQRAAGGRDTSVAIFNYDRVEDANVGREYIERPHTPRRERLDRGASSSGAGAPPASGSGAGGPGPSSRGRGRGGFLRPPSPPGESSSGVGHPSLGGSGAGAPPSSSASRHSPRVPATGGRKLDPKAPVFVPRTAPRASGPPPAGRSPDHAGKRAGTGGAAKARAKSPNKGRNG